jgi:hypothetical protein
MDLGKQAHRAKFMIGDRVSNYNSAFNAFLTDAGIRTVLCTVRTPHEGHRRTLDRRMPPRAPRGEAPRRRPTRASPDYALVGPRSRSPAIKDSGLPRLPPERQVAGCPTLSGH